MSIFDRALHIPVEPGFLASPGKGLERVLLPLDARPGWRLGVVASAAFLMAGACLFLGVAFFLGPAAGFGEYAFKFGAGGVFVGFACVPAGVVITAIRDLKHRRACLVVDSEGLRDARVGNEWIAWSAVSRAELVTSGPGACAVRLILRKAGPSFYNPFRVGGWCARWRGRRRERVVALLLLDQRPHVLAQTILALAARHGVEIDQPSPFAQRMSDAARSPWP
ncbi:MAG: hypothetical protein P4L76_14895 [Beijerinckiaceae bacterium]|nr:hypothetical protein [Beijerinckiaceae bacterium]